MSRRWWVLLGVLAVSAIVLGAAVIGRNASRTDPSASPSAAATPSGIAATAAPPSADPTSSPIPTSSAVPSPAAAATATPAPVATRPPRASGPPRLAYAAFLRRINDDRATVERLNGSLSTAAQAQDPVAVRTAAVDILDFVDRERDWLRENPPAECYSDAHAAAGAMLDAYGTAADAFIAWAETGGGFAGIPALGTALDAAQGASDALTRFGGVLEATRCPA
jgi:hypothetical protein